MEFIVIYCTVPNKKEGRTIAKALVENHIVACVNIIDKIESIFSWDGEMMEEKEALLIIKTKKEHFKKMMLLNLEFIQALACCVFPRFSFFY